MQIFEKCVSHSVKMSDHPHFFLGCWNLWQSATSRCSSRHTVTPSPRPTLNSPVFDLPTSLFLKSLKPISFTVHFLLSLYNHLGYLRTDIARFNQASLFHTHTLFAIIHLHHLIPVNLYFI